MKYFFYRWFNIFSFLKEVWQNFRVIRWCLPISLFVWFLFFLGAFLLVGLLSDFWSFIPLHYNIFFGIDRFGPAYSVFGLTVLGIFFIFLNYFLALKLATTNKVLFNFLIISTLLLEIILLIDELFIVLLNLT
jgi:hypothetical protein